MQVKDNSRAQYGMGRIIYRGVSCARKEHQISLFHVHSPGFASVSILFIPFRYHSLGLKEPSTSLTLSIPSHFQDIYHHPLHGADEGSGEGFTGIGKLPRFFVLTLIIDICKGKK